MNRTDEVIACPFCGARDAHNQSDHGDENQFVCAVCDARGPMKHSYRDVLTAWNTRATQPDAALREALGSIVAGDVSRPVGKIWRADGKRSKLDLCIHDIGMSADCGECISMFAAAALDTGAGGGA